MKKLLIMSVVALVAAINSAEAALTSSPYFFTDQPIAATGQFEWDEFVASFPPGPTAALGPHAADVANFGGAGTLDALDFTVDPFDGPPFPLITGTENIYAGGTIVDFDVELSGLDTTNAFTTVVLQIAATGEINSSSILLDGITPSSFVDRGIAGVLHDTDNSNAFFLTNFYWAAWQVAADADYLLEFANAANHTSLAQVRADYFNTAAPFTAVAASTVPEPATATLLALMLSGLVTVPNRMSKV